MISKKIIEALMIIGMWLLVLIAFNSQVLLLELAAVFLPFLIIISGRRDLWFVCIIALFRSGIKLPGLPQSILLYHLFIAIFIGLTVAYLIIKKPAGKPWSLSLLTLVAFNVVLLVTMFSRGSGLRFFGGTLWGGMSYVIMILISMFVFFSRYCSLTEREIKVALVLMLLFSFIPAAAQLIYIFSAGMVYIQFYFVEASGINALLTTTDALAGGDAGTRFQILGSLGGYIILCSLIFIPWRSGLRKIFLGLGIMIGFLLVGLSGFRSSLIGAGATIFFYLLLYRDQGRWHRIGPLVVVGLVGLVFVGVFARSLPFGLQRVLTIVPFVDVDPLVRMDAMASSYGRLEIWERAWHQVPDYFFIGKGFAFNSDMLLSISTQLTWALLRFEQHLYHSGPLSVQLDLGIFGTISCFLFMFFSVREFYIKRETIDVSKSPFLRRAFLVLFAHYLYQCLAFWLIFGDVKSTFPAILIQYIILRMILSTHDYTNVKNNIQRRENVKSSGSKLTNIV